MCNTTPPNGSAPPMGNPGSATAFVIVPCPICSNVLTHFPCPSSAAVIKALFLSLVLKWVHSAHVNSYAAAQEKKRIIWRESISPIYYLSCGHFWRKCMRKWKNWIPLGGRVFEHITESRSRCTYAADIEIRTYTGLGMTAARPGANSFWQNMRVLTAYWMHWLVREAV